MKRKEREHRGNKGTLFFTYFAPACGSRMGSAYGTTVRDIEGGPVGRGIRAVLPELRTPSLTLAARWR